MAGQNEVVVKLVASTAGFEQSIAKAQDAIQTKIGGAVAQTSAVTTTSARQIKREFGQIARTALQLGAALEAPQIAAAGMAFNIAGAAAGVVKSLQQMTTASTTAAAAMGAVDVSAYFYGMQQGATVAAASTSKLSGLLGKLGGVLASLGGWFFKAATFAAVLTVPFLALAAVVATLGWLFGSWLGKLVFGEGVTDAQVKAAYRLGEALKFDTEVLTEYNKAEERYNDELRKSAIHAGLFGDKLEQAKAKIESHKHLMEALTLAYQKLQEEQSNNYDANRQIRIDSLRAQFMDLYAQLAQLKPAMVDLQVEQKKYNDAMAEAAMRGALFGDTQAALKRQIDLTQDIIIEAAQAAEKLANAEDRALVTAQIEEYKKKLSELNAELGRQEAATKATAEALRDYEQSMHAYDIATIQADQLEQAGKQFYQWAAGLQANMSDVMSGAMAVTNSITSGIGGAFAQAIVYGQAFGEAMKQMLQSIAAMVIQMIIEIALQQLIYMALEALGIIQVASKKIAAEMAYGAVAAAASVYAGVPFPANMALAPAMGALAIASMSALANAAGAAGKTSVAGFATGGGAMGPMIAMVGETEPELIMPVSDYEKYLQGAGGNIHITLEMDGRRTAEVVVPHIPSVVRRAGIRGA